MNRKAKMNILGCVSKRGGPILITTVYCTSPQLSGGVFFDSETSKVQVTGYEETAAQVFLCD